MAAQSREPVDPQELMAERLRATGKLDDAALKRARRLASVQGERLAIMLARLGLVSERDIAEALAEGLGLPFYQRRDLPSAPVPAGEISMRFLRAMHILPIEAHRGGLVVAMADPSDSYALSAFEMAAGPVTGVAVAEPGAIEAVIDTFHSTDADDPAPEAEDLESDVERLRDRASEAPVVQLVNTMIATAVEARASDIHVQPGERDWSVRLRIDGLLSDPEPLMGHLAPAVVSRIKIMAQLDIAERRRPQDGRIRTAVRGRTIDLRVSVVPVMHGESVVIRVLDREGVTLDFRALGIAERDREAIERVLAQPRGIFLVTGPTGSGKTTSLYTALRSVNRPELKVLTVEDPIEYQIDGCDQVQVHAAIGLDFATVLRSLLRHDPDVMMVGEIRDGETAQVATQAALTGHLVISTLHTNDAPGAVTRLTDMGVEPFLIASTLSAVLAQRLVRRLCPDCRQAAPAPDAVIEQFALGAEIEGGRPMLWRPVGCDSCRGRGYRGRAAIVEMMPMTSALRELVLSRPGTEALRRAADAEGVRPMLADGVDKAVAGITTLEEVMRATQGT